jgi:hypothetical protein
LRRAARLEDKHLRFLPTGADRVRFQIVEPAAQLRLVLEEPSEEPAPTKLKVRGPNDK